MPGDEWLDRDDEMGLWEHQGHPLTARWLAVALQQLIPSAMPDAMTLLRSTDEGAELPVEVVWYDGTTAQSLEVMHLDVRGAGGKPAALVVTVSGAPTTAG